MRSVPFAKARRLPSGDQEGGLMAEPWLAVMAVPLATSTILSSVVWVPVATT